MIKNMLVDGDGVIINKPMQFSERLSKSFNVPMEEILPFFKNEFQQCLVGKADLKEVVKPYLRQWKWKNSVEDLLIYWFENENFLDDRVIADIRRFRAYNVKCYMHSNQEKYRTEYITTHMGLEREVDGIFSSAFLGVKKPQLEFWHKIFEIIQPAKKNEVLVWDDDELNVASAKAFGFEAEFYRGHGDFISRMKSYLPYF